MLCNRGMMEYSRPTVHDAAEYNKNAYNQCHVNLFFNTVPSSHHALS